MENITVIIETPKGKNHKYDYEPDQNFIKLKKVMPAGLVFPFDFGYIPNTIGEDGDPLDVLVISEIEMFPGCAVDCRIIGAIQASQTERNNETMRNDRFIAVPEVSQWYAKTKALADIPKEIINQIENFFINYNEQASKKFNPLKHVSSEKAYKIIEKAKQQSLTKQINLYLPLYDKNGKAFPKQIFQDIRVQLVEKFGGITIYTRNPATGFWKDDQEQTVKDDILIYEIMLAELDKKYWDNFKASLLKTFKQAEIIIKITPINLI